MSRISNMLSQITFLALLLGIANCFQKFHPSRTVPSSWFQDGTKYLQPIAEQDVDFKDNVDLDLAASELTDRQAERFIQSSYVNDGIDRIASSGTKRDQVSAASGDNHGGRVQIKVYRGPDSGGHHETFAPYGYWVKQPADYDHH